MRRHAIEQVVLSSSNRLSKRRPLAKRFKTDLIPMFVGALIACFFLSIVWTVRIQKVEEKKHGGKDVLDGLVPNTNTKFLKSTPPEEFSAIPKDDYANDDDIDDDNDDDDNERGRDDEGVGGSYSPVPGDCTKASPHRTHPIQELVSGVG